MTDEQADPQSVSLMLQQLQLHDPNAATEIWNRYVERLIPIVRQRLRGLRSAEVDEEDVVVSVFDRFFRAAEQGQFGKLSDRNDLWQILLLLTDRRVTDQYRRSHAEKRGGGRVIGYDQLAQSGEFDPVRIRALAEKNPSPDFTVALSDQIEHLLRLLDDDIAREVALLRMQGFEHSEIAERLDVSRTTVERKLRVVRSVWRTALE